MKPQRNRTLLRPRLRRPVFWRVGLIAIVAGCLVLGMAKRATTQLGTTADPLFLPIGLADRELIGAARPVGSAYLPWLGQDAADPKPDPTLYADVPWAAQIGGPTLTIEMVKDRVYRGEGPHVVAARFVDANDVGRSPLLPGMVRDLVLADDHLIVALGEAGVVALARREPELRAVGAWVPGAQDARGAATPSMSVHAVAADGGRVLALTTEGVLFVLSRAADGTLAELGSIPLERVAVRDGAGLELEGNVAIVGRTDVAAVLVDVSRPEHPHLITELVDAGTAGGRDVALRDGHAYALTCAICLSVWRITTPERPRLLRSGRSAAEWAVPVMDGQPVAVEELDFRRLTAEGDHVVIGGGRIALFVDVTRPSNPAALTAWRAATPIVALGASAQRLAVSLQEPVDPHVEDEEYYESPDFLPHRAQGGWWALGLAVGGTALRVEPRAHRPAITTLFVDEKRIYLQEDAWEPPRRVWIVDPEGPYLMREVRWPSRVGWIEASDGNLMLAECEEAMDTYLPCLIDVRAPGEPRIVGDLSFLGNAYMDQVAMNDGLLAIADIVGEEGQFRRVLWVIDVSDPERPNALGMVDFEGVGWDSGIAIERRVVYGLDGRGRWRSRFPSLWAFSPVESSSVGLRKHRVEFQDQWEALPTAIGVVDRALLAFGSPDRVAVFDLEDPQRPREMQLSTISEWAETPGLNYFGFPITAVGGRLLVPMYVDLDESESMAACREGLYVLDVPSPERVHFLGRLQLPEHWPVASAGEGACWTPHPSISRDRIVHEHHVIEHVRGVMISEALP